MVRYLLYRRCVDNGGVRKWTLFLHCFLFENLLWYAGRNYHKSSAPDIGHLIKSIYHILL